MKKYLYYIVNRIYLLLFLVAIFVVGCCLALLVVAFWHPWPYALLGALGLLMVALLGCFAYQCILKPLEALERIKRQFAKGAVFNDIFAHPHHFSQADDDVLLRFFEMLDTRQFLSASKKEAEYLVLQNQINPHFLYNTLEGIRSEALLAGMDTIAEMTEALATFFRYTISQAGNLVTLEDELENIENYYFIQQFRFGERLELAIVYDADPEFDESQILKVSLPKLTLQPIVENAIYHGLETKIGKGHLKIHIAATNEALTVKVSDDGIGIPKKRLDQMNDSLRLLLKQNPPGDSAGDGIAVQNVNNRIKLLFGERYGIHIYSKEGVGTDVYITLPIK